MWLELTAGYFPKPQESCIALREHFLFQDEVFVILCSGAMGLTALSHTRAQGPATLAAAVIMEAATPPLPIHTTAATTAGAATTTTAITTRTTLPLRMSTW